MAAIGSIPPKDRAAVVAKLIADGKTRVELVAARGSGSHREYRRGDLLAVTYNYTGNSDGNLFSVVIHCDPDGDGRRLVVAYTMGSLRWLQPVSYCRAPDCGRELPTLDLMSGAVVKQTYSFGDVHTVKPPAKLAVERGDRCEHHREGA